MRWPAWLGYDVFISYNQDSASYAKRLADLLENRGLQCFFDQQTTPPGTVLEPEIEQALTRSRFLVLVLTDGALRSAWVKSELNCFAYRPDRVICISVGGLLKSPMVLSTPFWWLRELSWIDESLAAIATSRPSPHIVEGVLAARGRRRVKNGTRAIAAAVLLAFVAAGVLIVRSTQSETQQKAIAAAQTELASTQKAVADAQTEIASTQTALADRRAAVSKIQDLVRESIATTLPVKRRILLAAEAYRRSRSLDGEMAMLAEHALRAAIFATDGTDLAASETGRDSSLSSISSGEGRWLAAGLEGPPHKLLVWDLSGPRFDHPSSTIDLPFAPGPVTISADGNTVGTRPIRFAGEPLKPVYIWRRSTNDARYEGPTPYAAPSSKDLELRLSDGVSDLVLSPTGEWAAVLGQVYQTKNHSKEPIVSFTPGASAVFSRDGRWLALWSLDYLGLPEYGNLYDTRPLDEDAASEQRAQARYDQAFERYRAYLKARGKDPEHVGLVASFENLPNPPIVLGMRSPTGTEQERKEARERFEQSIKEYETYIDTFAREYARIGPAIEKGLSVQTSGIIFDTKSATPTPLRRWTRYSKRTDTPVFSADGCWFATADIVDSLPCRPGRTSAEYQIDDAAIDFSPDSRFAVTAAPKNTRVWTLVADRAPRAAPLPNPDMSGSEARLSPDGRWLATVSKDGVQILLWDLRRPRPLDEPAVRLRPTSGAVWLQFDPGGRYLLSGRTLYLNGGTDSAATLWDLGQPDPATSAIDLSPAQSEFNDRSRAPFRFDPGSRFLLSGRSTPPYGLTLWPLAVNELIGACLSYVKEPMSADEWSSRFPGEPYVDTLAALRTIVRN